MIEALVYALVAAVVLGLFSWALAKWLFLNLNVGGPGGGS